MKVEGEGDRSRDANGIRVVLKVKYQGAASRFEWRCTTFPTVCIECSFHVHILSLACKSVGC